MKLSGYFVSPTMLQSVAWLSFSVFDGSLKVEIEIFSLLLTGLK